MNTDFNNNLCVCGSSDITSTRVRSGKWLGSSYSNMKEYSLTDERFETREYSLGFDYYANGDLLKTYCEKCGKKDFVSF